MAADGGLARLNALDDRAATDVLRACNGSTAWVAAVLDNRPYPSVAALLAASDEACRQLGSPDIDEALDDHPRIGERARSDGEQARLSRQEQASVSGAGDDLRGALAAGNRPTRSAS